MRSIWFDSWSPRMELITLLLLPRLLTDDAWRARLVARVSDPLTRAFFDVRFQKWRDTYRDEAIEPMLNKTEAFLAFPAIRNSLGQSRSSLHLPYAMDSKAASPRSSSTTSPPRRASPPPRHPREGGDPRHTGRRPWLRRSQPSSLTSKGSE
jgi:hypothetical protein